MDLREREKEQIEERKKGGGEGMSKYKVDLREREKELNCLYEVSELIASTDLTLDECLQRIADVLPKSLAARERGCGRVRVGERAFTTAGWTAGLTNAIVAEVAASESNNQVRSPSHADVEKEFWKRSIR